MEIKKNDLNEIELVNDNKKIELLLTKLNYLIAKFSYEDKKKPWMFEYFEFNKDDKEIYSMVNGLFASYSGDVYFSTIGSRMNLFRDENGYKLMFSNEYDGEVLVGKFAYNTMENNSMKDLFYKLNEYYVNKNEEQKVKCLSKTLKKILDK